MPDQEAATALATLIKALKSNDQKLLAAALATQGTCLRCKGTFQWGKGIDILARTISCPHCGAEIRSSSRSTLSRRLCRGEAVGTVA